MIWAFAIYAAGAFLMLVLFGYTHPLKNYPGDTEYPFGKALTVAAIWPFWVLMVLPMAAGDWLRERHDARTSTNTTGGNQ